MKLVTITYLPGPHANWWLFQGHGSKAKVTVGIFQKMHLHCIWSTHTTGWQFAIEDGILFFLNFGSGGHSQWRYILDVIMLQIVTIHI